MADTQPTPTGVVGSQQRAQTQATQDRSDKPWRQWFWYTALAALALGVVVIGYDISEYVRSPQKDGVPTTHVTQLPQEVPFKVTVKLTHRDQVSTWHKVPFCYNVKWDGEPRGIPFKAEYLDGNSLKQDYKSGTTPTDIKSVRFVAVVNTATIVLVRWRSSTCG